MAQPTYISIEEAAKKSGVSYSTLAKLTASAEVSSVRLGRRRFYIFDTLMSELSERGRRDRVVDPRKRQRVRG
jgi:excisionase family DNA binding protein